MIVPIMWTYRNTTRLSLRPLCLVGQAVSKYFTTGYSRHVFTDKRCLLTSLLYSQVSLPRQLHVYIFEKRHFKKDLYEVCHKTIHQNLFHTTGCLEGTDPSKERIRYSKIKTVNSQYEVLDNKFSQCNLTHAVLEELEVEFAKINNSKLDIFDNVLMMYFFDKRNIDGGHFLMDYLTYKGKNISRIVRIYYIALLGETNIEHSHDEMMYTQYNLLTETTDVLDYNSLKKLIKAFLTTRQWKEKSLKFINVAHKLSLMSVHGYGEVLKKCVEKGDVAFLNSMVDDALSCVPGDIRYNDQSIQEFQTVCRLLLEACDRNVEGVSILDMFKLCRKTQIILQTDLALQVRNYLSKSGNWTADITQIDPRGCCKNCGEKLEEQPELTDEEFRELKDSFLEHTLHAGRKFWWTTPEELKKFEMFLKNIPYSFDVVIDGLNIYYGYLKDSRHVIQSVIDKFSHANKKVLVVGKKSLNFVTGADLLIVDRHSHDDFFLLYAALHSGPSCMFISNDRYTDCRYLLGPKKESLFFKWQTTRQIFFDKKILKGKNFVIQCLLPGVHLLNAQGTDKGWHIPFADDSHRRNLLSTRPSFICAQKTH